MTFPGVDWVDNVPTDQEARTQDLHRRGGDVYFIIHHSVTTRVQDTIATFKSDREVSANFAIGPIISGSDDIKVALTVPEDRRAWTSASPLDDRALTTEVCDKALGGNYPISDRAKRILAEIAAYMHTEYGMPLDRIHILTHQEVYARGYGSYATACAGPDMQASMDWIVQTAIDIVNGTEEEDVATYPASICYTTRPDNTPDPREWLVWPAGRRELKPGENQTYADLGQVPIGPDGKRLLKWLSPAALAAIPDLTIRDKNGAPV